MSSIRLALPVALAALLLSAGPLVRAQADLELLPAQGQVSALVSAAGNAAVQIGADGPLVVDTLPAAMSERVLAAVRTLSPRPIRHVVLTSGEERSAGGAPALAKAGRFVRVIDSIDPRGIDTRASIIAHLEVLNRMTAANAPSGAWPTDTYFTAQWPIFSNGEGIELVHVSNAHTDGDTIVFFRRSDVVVAGAIFDTTAYPRFVADKGGSIDGVIDGLNRILDIAIPGENQEGGTVVIPGRGRLSDETDVANYRDMVTIVRDRIRDMVKKGASVEAVKRARPTSDYDGLYASPEWTADQFVEAVYASVRKGAR